MSGEGRVAMMTAVEAFDRYCQAWIAKDGAAMAALFTEDGEFDTSTLDAPIRGRAALAKQLRIIAASHTQIETETRRAIETPTGALIEATYSARVIGAGGKVDGSPNRADFKLMAVVEMRDGLIARLREIFDARPLYNEERQRMWTMNRLTPYWPGVAAAGCMEWSVYNNMFFPMIYSRAPYEDYAALMEGVTLWDVALERQTEIRGPDARAFLDYLCCRDMSDMAPGECRYTLMSDENGVVLGDPVVLMPWENVAWISHGNTDMTLWARGIAMDSDWDVTISEPDVAPLQLQGPLARDVLSQLCDAPLAEMKNYTCVETEVAGQPAIVSRTGWSGGFGYEIFPLSSARAMDLWNALLEAGAPFDLKVTGPVVHRAVERGVTDTGYYANSNMNALEDLGARVVDLDKPADFIGKSALQRIRAAGVTRRSIGLFIDGEIPRLEWHWPIALGGRPVGEVRWAVHSFALDRSIAIAILDASVEIGAQVQVTHPQGTVAAEVTAVPFVSRES